MKIYGRTVLAAHIDERGALCVAQACAYDHTRAQMLAYDRKANGEAFGDERPVRIPRRFIRQWAARGYGWINLREALRGEGAPQA